MKTCPDKLSNPFTEFDDQGRPVNIHLGLTKREYFAGLAMQGLLANKCGNKDKELIAMISVIHTDALIKELNK